MPETETAPIVRDPRLLAFFAGRTLSSFASQIQAVAIGWQIYALTGRPLALGLVGLDFAATLAIGAQAGFVGIWSGFLIGGQWFYYWYGAYGQGTHFRLLLWGLAALLLVAV